MNMYKTIENKLRLILHTTFRLIDPKISIVYLRLLRNIKMNRQYL